MDRRAWRTLGIAILALVLATGAGIAAHWAIAGKQLPSNLAGYEYALHQAALSVALEPVGRNVQMPAVTDEGQAAGSTNCAPQFGSESVAIGSARLRFASPTSVYVPFVGFLATIEIAFPSGRGPDLDSIARQVMDRLSARDASLRPASYTTRTCDELAIIAFSKLI